MLNSWELPLRELSHKMVFVSVVLAAAFATVANAHFQLQYPVPRGPFVQDSEPTFCGQ